MNKKFILMGLPILALALITAGIIYYGQVQRNVTINQAVLFEGDSAMDVTISAGETIYSEDLSATSQTSVIVPLAIDTEVLPNDCSIENVNQFLLNNLGGTCEPYPSPTCEKRIVVTQEDLNFELLSDLNSISWDADVVNGYLPHVDVFLDNGESLTFEYAKVQAPCDNAPYPTGQLSTFDDKGIVDNDAYAWESIPGYCGLAEFDEQHKSLADWKAFYPTAKIERIEVEVDNWISGSNSLVKNIKVNGNDVEVSLLPYDSLNFNVATTFGLLCLGNYSVTTTVTVRE